MLRAMWATGSFDRTVSLPEANKALAKVETGLELGDLELIGETERSLVAGYNRDDCLSTAALRDWLDRSLNENVTKEAR